jgi:AAA15 family ATPase/GTPase
MNNTILKYLSVENFASFADKIEFTTEIDSGKKEFMESAFSCGDKQFNKVSFLYGANGSGKTFFCKIIREIQRLLEWSPLCGMNNSELLSLPQLKGMDAPITTFAFDMSYEEKPTRFIVEIILDGITYHYEFAVLNRKIEYELLTKKYRRTEKLIERTSPSYKDIILKSDMKDFENTKQVVKEEALCLPIAALLNNKMALKINAAIKGICVVSMTAARLKPTNSKEAFSDERLAKYINILQKADPTLRDIKVSFEEEEIAHQKIDSDDFENREIIAKKMTVGVDTVHAVFKDGKETTSTPITFFADESLGTVKLFTALPYLFDILESGGVLVIDEIENGLHLSLAKEIVALFMNESTNPNHAQLICTSHQPLLLDGAFRRDQVWIASKDALGKSSLHRLSDYKTSRAKVNLTNKILEGAFGCNPNNFFK